MKKEQGVNRTTILPTKSEERKMYPIACGVLDYFPDALAAVSHVSYVGNQQHNPGQPLFWNRAKSQDHADTLVRHLLERGTRDTDGLRHTAKVAWRALALLQIEIEKEKSLIVDNYTSLKEYAQSSLATAKREVEDELQKKINRRVTPRRKNYTNPPDGKFKRKVYSRRWESYLI